MTRDVPIHYLRPNEREWTPAAIIGLDTETQVITPGDRELLGLRLWVAHYVDRRVKAGTPARDAWAHGDSAQSLAKQVDSWFVGRSSVWLCAHNLAFDLVTTRLPWLLGRLGWRVSDAALQGRSPWIKLGRGRRTLTIVDSGSWLPLPLDEIAVRMGMVKPPLPADDDSETAWLDRCRADVDIMLTAMLDLMAWWDKGKLGNWTLSGPACGWNAHRHIGSDYRVVINVDPGQVEADRTAVRGGRRQVWTIGEHRAGPFAELDFVAAYPTIAAHLPLPRERAYPFTSLPVGDPAMTEGRWGVLARCRIATGRSRWPVRLGGDTWYPVGEFWADLAQPDIDEAIRLDALQEVGAGWCHQLAPHLAPWARWCLATQHDTSGATPEVGRIAAKMWGRTVIGRYAMRGHTKVEMGPATVHGWHAEQGWDSAAGCEATMIDLDGRRWWVVNDGVAENAYPAVTAWVESEVRVRLGRALDALGPGCVLQCDTDGMIVALRTVGTAAARGSLRAPSGLSAVGRLNWCLDQIEPAVSPLTLRVKRTAEHVTVLGPQHVRIDSQRRFAGMPRSATETTPGTFTARTWPGLTWQMEHGDSMGYVRPTQTYHVLGPYPTGWILADNRVVPVTMRIGTDGRNQIMPFRDTALGRSGAQLADVQHRTLDALR